MATSVHKWSATPRLSLQRTGIFRLWQLFFAVFLGAAASAFATGTISLAWDANTESDLLGYRLYYGQSSGNYDTAVDVGNHTYATVGDLTEGTTYYFAITAYDTAHQESALSAEVSRTVGTRTTVDFSATPTEGHAPLGVSFTDQSSLAATSWNWDFGDGSTSTKQNPTHTYNTPGIYDVTLQTADGNGADTTTKTGYITVYAPPTASFTATTSVGAYPLQVNFSDTSSGTVTGWAWDFGDGTTSTEQNPVHTYTVPGTYSVSLAVTGPAGDDAVTQTDFVNVLDVDAIIVDNGDVGTSFTGTWPVSGGLLPYPPATGDSLYSRDGDTYTWSFTAADTGSHDVSMWWSGWDSRGSNIPVQIEHDGGMADVKVNQQENAGQWNFLGNYQFTAGKVYAVTIVAVASPASTAADAVKFSFADAGDFYTGPSLDSIAVEGPTSIDENSTAQFAARAYYSDGSNAVVAANTWNVTGTVATIDGAGTLAAGEVSADTSVDVTASYSENGVSKSATATVTVKDQRSTVETVFYVDNGSANTSYTGTWAVSSGTPPWPTDGDSVWSRDGDTYTWSFTPQTSGNYDIAMWWSAYSSRGSSIPVKIQHTAGTATVNVNQQQNGGAWNSQGEYQLEAGVTYNVTIISTSYPDSTCADAVRFSLIDGGTVQPDVTTLTVEGPTAVDENTTASYQLRATYSDGTDKIVAADSWSVTGTAATIAADGTLTAGEVTADTAVQVNATFGTLTAALDAVISNVPAVAAVIIDNDDPQTSYTGWWAASGAAGAYPLDTGTSLYSRDGHTYTWTFTPPADGNYDVAMWWTEYSSRSSSIPVQITSANSTSTVTINQQTNGGKWNSLGEYQFVAGQAYTITIVAQPGPSSTCADAVRFTLVDGGTVQPELTTLSIEGPTAVEENTTASYQIRATYSDGTDSIVTADSWGVKGTAATIAADGTLTAGEVTADTTVQVSAAYGSLTATHDVVVSNVAATVQSIAVEGPTAVDENTTASYQLRATYSDGTDSILTADSWGVTGTAATIAADGTLTAGEVTADTTVQVNASYGSLTATRDVVISDIPAVAAVIIDNGDPETSFTGVWAESGASNAYPLDTGTSLYSRDGYTYTWTFTPPADGYYDVAMWWTEWSSRSTSIPVHIANINGTDTVTINQQSNGGMWNSLGEYPFVAGQSYAVTIVSQPGPSSTCADAMRFTWQRNYEIAATVSITFPQEKHLQAETSLTATAEATGLKTGEGVKFVVNEGQTDEVSQTANDAPYSVTFTGLAKGTHTVDAYIVDKNGTASSDATAHDQVTDIGIGDIYVAFGDSLMTGYGDDIAADDVSADGRNSGGGFAPVLNDLLTAAQGYPHSIIVEAELGTTSSNGAASIRTVLDANPTAEKILILFGINDAEAAVPSGIGMTTADKTYPGTYKANLQSIITAVNDAGRQALLAKPPIALGYQNDVAFSNPDAEPINALLREYGNVIDELAQIPANNVVAAPADFYAYFAGYEDTGIRRCTNEYSDNVHPNGVGYAGMTEVWLNALTKTQAVIGQLLPNPALPGETVTMTGYGKSPAGASIVAHEWMSDIDGLLGTTATLDVSTLSPGTHTITLNVEDSQGTRASAAGELQVAEAVVDNRDPDTAYTGAWKVSGASGAHGDDSFWSRDGTTFTWFLTPKQTGEYNLLMWWTMWKSRSDNVPADITSDAGTKRITIDQLNDGARWVPLSRVTLTAGRTYSITITSQAHPASTCADAVMLVPANR